MDTFSFMCLSLECSAIIMYVIVLLPVSYGTILAMLRIRMQSESDLGKHPKTKASRILNEEWTNISIAQSQHDHPQFLQMWLVLLEDFQLWVLWTKFNRWIHQLWLHRIWCGVSLCRVHHLLCQELKSWAMDPKVLRCFDQCVPYKRVNYMYSL